METPSDRADIEARWTAELDRRGLEAAKKLLDHTGPGAGASVPIGFRPEPTRDFVELWIKRKTEEAAIKAENRHREGMRKADRSWRTSLLPIGIAVAGLALALYVALLKPDGAPAPDSRTRSAAADQERGQKRALVVEFLDDWQKSNDDQATTSEGRLNQAEAYINERLAQRGATWRLNRETRTELGLPPP
jgi:hypothetical protein